MKFFSTILKAKISFFSSLLFSSLLFSSLLFSSLLFSSLLFSSLLFSVEVKGQEFCDTGGWNDLFDFRQPLFQMYLSPQGSQMIPNPYHASGAFLNPNIEELAWPSQKDYDPNDGWVYIAHDFGTPFTNVPTPHFILYNRMSGILRTFFLVTQLYDQNDRATINIRFGNVSKKSAVLERYNGTNSMNAVTSFTTGSVGGLVANELANSVPYWIHADFIMTYDPCMCNTAGASKLYIEAKLYKKEILNFTIDGQIKQDMKPSVSSTDPSFTSTLKPLVNGLNVIGSILTSTKSFEKITGGGFSPFSAALGAYAGPWAGLADFVVGLVNPTKPATPQPLLFDVKLGGNGQINYVSTAKTAIIATPGSKTNGVDPAHIPSYNHILGTFNLMYAPYVYIHKSTVGGANLTALDCEIETNYYQFECIQPIQWVYNPYMPLNWVTWRAAYVIELSNGQRVLTEDFPMGCFQDYKPVFKAERRRGGCNYTEPYPVNVYIQVLAMGLHPNNIESIFMQVYNVNSTIIGEGYGVLEESKPAPGCNTFLQPATESAIYGNCNYSNYPQRANSLAPQDSTSEVEYLASVARNNKSLILKANPINNQLNISPNPISEMGIINCELNADSQISIYLTDISGKVVKSFIQNEFRNKGQFTLDFLRNDLSAGMYFVVMETNGGRVTQKLMLK